MENTTLRELQRRRLFTTARMGYEQAGAQIDRVLRDEVTKKGLRWVDTPCQSEDEDAFEFTKLAENLFGTMSGDSLETPYTLCIDGQWGAGKSSLARILYSKFLEDSIIQRGFLPVWIDSSLMIDKGSVLQLFADTTLQQAILLAQRILTSPGQKGKFDEHVAPLLPVTQLCGKGGKASDETKLQSVLRNDANSWLKEWQNQEGTPWNVPRFRKLVASIRHGLLGRGGLSRIVWFVDDLDRCRSEVILTTLDIQRSLLEQWGAMLVYPMNVSIVAAVIEKHFLVQGNVTSTRHIDPYEDVYVEQAWTYLEKMFFRRVRPPEPTESHLNKWLKKLLPPDAFFDGLAEFMRDAYFGNPRYIKRFATSVKYLCERYAVAAKDDTWEGLLSLNDNSLGVKLIAKVAAFALAENYRPFYEPVRKPDPRQLITSEINAFAGDPLPCVVLEGEVREFVEAPVPGPRILVDFLKSGPKLQNNFAATRSAVLVVESILPTPRVRVRTSGRIETAVSDKKASRKPRSDLTGKEREMVQDLVGKWRNDLEQKIVIPSEIISLLQTAVPDSCVSVLKEKNWKPLAEDLIGAAAQPLSENRLRDVMWHLAAAAIHESWDAADLTATLEIVTRAKNLKMEVAFARLGLLRHGNDPEARTECCHRLVNFDQEEIVNEGLNGLLGTVGLSVETLKQPTIVLSDRFDEEVFERAFLAVLDGLRQLKRSNEELRFAMAGLKTNTGKNSSKVVRNVARSVMTVAQDKSAARNLYHHAIALDPDDDVACAWSMAHSENASERLRCLQAGMDRDPSDSRYPTLIGVELHNSERRNEATPWLELGVAMDPNDEEGRDALRQNLVHTRGAKEASKATDPDYVPTVDDRPLRKQARDAHRDLMQEILRAGAVQYAGVALFDPAKPPGWIFEKFPELRTP